MFVELTNELLWCESGRIGCRVVFLVGIRLGREGDQLASTAGIAIEEVLMRRLGQFADYLGFHI